LGGPQPGGKSGDVVQLIKAANDSLKTGNKQTALDRLRGKVRAPEMRKRMPGFERAPVAKPGDQ